MLYPQLNVDLLSQYYLTVTFDNQSDYIKNIPI